MTASRVRGVLVLAIMLAAIAVFTEPPPAAGRMIAAPLMQVSALLGLSGSTSAPALAS